MNASSRYTNELKRESSIFDFELKLKKKKLSIYTFLFAYIHDLLNLSILYTFRRKIHFSLFLFRPFCIYTLYMGISAYVHARIDSIFKLVYLFWRRTVSGAFGSSHSLWENPYSHPYFDNSTKRDLTITVGQTAQLPCRVRNLGDRAVSKRLHFFSTF